MIQTYDSVEEVVLLKLNFPTKRKTNKFNVEGSSLETARVPNAMMSFRGLINLIGNVTA